MPGCLRCQLYSDIEDENTLLLLEQWADESSLISHLRDEGAKVLLSSIDYACELPEVRIETVAGTRGVEFIGECRAGIHSR